MKPKLAYKNIPQKVANCMHAVSLNTAQIHFSCLFSLLQMVVMSFKAVPRISLVESAFHDQGILWYGVLAGMS